MFRGRIKKPLLPEWRYWPAVALVALIAIALAGSSLSAPPPQQHRQDQTAEHSTSGEAPAISADDKIADYTAILAWFTGLLAVFTVALWWVTERTLSHSRADSDRQARDMEKSLAISKQAADAAVAGQRPWLKVNVEIDSSLTFGPDNVDFFPKVTIKNVGSTPATNAQLTISVRPESASRDESGLKYAIFNATRIARERKTFSRDEYVTPLEGIFGVTVFPGDEVEMTAIYWRSSRKNLEYEISEGGGDTTVCVYVVISVDYQFPGGEGLTVTPFSLERIEFIGDDDDPGWFDSTVTEFEQSNLRLRRLGLYDSAT